jgi:hypothetical protein
MWRGCLLFVPAWLSIRNPPFRLMFCLVPLIHLLRGCFAYLTLRANGDEPLYTHWLRCGVVGCCPCLQLRGRPPFWADFHCCCCVDVSIIRLSVGTAMNYCIDLALVLTLFISVHALCHSSSNRYWLSSSHPSSHLHLISAHPLISSSHPPLIFLSSFSHLPLILLSSSTYPPLIRSLLSSIVGRIPIELVNTVLYSSSVVHFVFTHPYPSSIHPLFFIL